MPAKALHHRHRCKTVWTQTELVLTTAEIEHRIYNFRGVQVMVDQDLADLYGVETRCLNEQVKRNIDRFPERFMFQLTKEEFLNLTSQIATSKWGGRRTLPYVFTEQGVAMLATVNALLDLAIEPEGSLQSYGSETKELAASIKKEIDAFKLKYSDFLVEVVEDKSNTTDDDEDW